MKDNARIPFASDPHARKTVHPHESFDPSTTFRGAETQSFARSDPYKAKRRVVCGLLAIGGPRSNIGRGTILYDNMTLPRSISLFRTAAEYITYLHTLLGDGMTQDR